MARMKFLEPGNGQRVECYLMPPKFKLDKLRDRYCVLLFSVKLKPELAAACDERIQRAYEDVETLEREIDEVKLNSAIVNTNVDFYDLPAGNGGADETCFALRNVTLDAIVVFREKGVTYLYFGAELKLTTLRLGAFAQSRFGTVVHCTFTPSQQAVVEPVAYVPSESPVAIAAATAEASLLDEGAK